METVLIVYCLLSIQSITLFPSQTQDLENLKAFIEPI
jgi:hypothetical protein